MIDGMHVAAGSTRDWNRVRPNGVDPWGDWGDWVPDGWSRVHQDGTIGIGYLRAPKAVAVDPDVDVDDLAAEHRLLCYQKYADDLPADGGTPTVTPRVAEARARRATSNRADAEAKLCPIHFVELSTNGLCSFCD